MTKLQLKLAQIYEEKGYEPARLFWAEIQENMPALTEKERSDLKNMMSRYCKMHGDEAYSAAILSEGKDPQTKESIGFFFDFARIYYVGENVAKNESKSEQLCKMILDHGDSDDLYKLGKMYRFGDGVAKNESKAAECFKKSAVGGNKLAAYLLGEMYMLGCGVEKNRTEAENWYNVANAERNVYSNTISRMVIPDGITRICEGAFVDFENIRSIVFPASVNTIGANAFKGCKNLASITVANEKIIVETDAFKGCENLDEDAKKLGEKFTDMVFVSAFENDGDTIPSFYIAKYLVTQELYESVTGENPSFFKGERLPVESVSFRDAALFCNKLSEKHGFTPCYIFGYGCLSCNFKANGYRLPTVTEWKFAAMGRGKSKEYFSYSGSDIVDEVAWYIDNSEGRTHNVGEKKANELGIYDMSGNVYELSQPFGGYINETGENIPVLGGAYNCIDIECVISAMKYYSLPDKKRGNRTGFRIVRNGGGAHYDKQEIVMENRRFFLRHRCHFSLH